MGGAGGIVALPNLNPRIHRRLYDAFTAGQLDTARELQALLSHGDNLVNRYGGVGFMKAVIEHRFGYGQPFVRAPLSAGSLNMKSDSDKKTLEKILSLEESL
jgi:4-hydroxy-2-oxoglutarate aldolase